MCQRAVRRANRASWIATVVVLAFVASCSRDARSEGPAPDRAFYYWRTTFKLSPPEQRAIADLHINKLYVRMFDVEWNEVASAPGLVGKITIGDGARVPDGVEVVPVVFLRESVFRRLGQIPSAELARTAWLEVERRAKLLGFTPRELQLDCDWTDGTRDAFFAFVKQMRTATSAARVSLSATIRLHQVKYRERTGVPPVDRGMLMFYNMGEFSADPEARAIFDPKSAERYLARVEDYPLALDVALPIWSWTVHLRDDRVEGLMQSTDPAELPTLPFLERSAGSSDRFVATRNAFLHGTLLREGDVLKVEVTGPAEALAAATMIAPRLARRSRTVSLFDLSERNVTRHGLDSLDNVFHAVR